MSNAGQVNRPGLGGGGSPVVLGSGLIATVNTTLVTSGQLIDRQSAGTIWEVRWNMSGVNASGFNPQGAGLYAGQILPGAMGLVSPGGGSQSPIVGGTPVGTWWVEGSSDGVYYSPLLGGGFNTAAAASGQMFITMSGINPDYQRLRLACTTGSGVFNTYFGSRSY
jgi:hypothetical protein